MKLPNKELPEWTDAELLAWLREKYSRSQWTQYREGDSAVLELCARLERPNAGGMRRAQHVRHERNVMAQRTKDKHE